VDRLHHEELRGTLHGERAVKGVILAAGLGTRLFPLTLVRSKPAVPFLNRPIIQYSFDLLAKLGVTDCVVNLHHLPGTIQEAIGIPDIKVSFSYEPEILGTAGAIGKVRDLLREDLFVVCNGKIYFEEDLSEAVEFHRTVGATATLVLVPREKHPEFNPVFLGSDHRVKGFGPGYVPEEGDLAAIFTGVHIMSPQVLDLIPDGPCDTVRDLYLGMIRRGLPLYGYVSQAYWCEISTPSRYFRKSMEVLRKRGATTLPPNLPAGCRDVIAADSVVVDPSAELEGCVLWENSVIGANARLRNVIVTGNIAILPEARVAEAVVTGSSKGTDRLAEKGGRREVDLLIWPLW
jgi:NDP-sugar pyrophosphorylase family protein